MLKCNKCQTPIVYNNKLAKRTNQMSSYEAHAYLAYLLYCPVCDPEVGKLTHDEETDSKDEG